MRPLLLAAALLALAAPPARADAPPGLSDTRYLKSVLAQALGKPAEAIVSAEAIALAGAGPHRAAVVGLYREDGWTFAALVPLDRCPAGGGEVCFGRLLHLGGARTVRIGGEIDLLASQSIDPESRGLRPPAAPCWPALLVQAQTNADGVEQMAWLISLRGPEGAIAFARASSRRYTDGGGFRALSWKLEPQGDRPALTTTEQREDPRRARCLIRPDVRRFLLDPQTGRLSEREPFGPSHGCGD